MYTRDEMKKYLRTSDYCFVTFMKADKSMRDMRATLNEMSIPTPEHITDDQKKRVYTDEVLRVWDIDKGAWRSFRVDSVVLFNAVSE